MRVFVTMVNGDGTETILHPDLPVDDVEVTWALSEPHSVKVKITPETPTLEGLWVPWHTALYVEDNGQITAGGILTESGFDDEQLELTFTGHSGYLTGMPWTDDDENHYDIDPTDALRLVWTMVQNHPRGDVGVRVNQLTTGVKIGVKVDEVKDGEGNVTVQAKDEPWHLSISETTDLGSVQNDLIKAGRIEWVERHSWMGGQIRHDMVLASPRIGARKPSLRLVIGENVLDVPGLSLPDNQYASEVLVLGAGEGIDRIWTHRRTSSAPRLRRVFVRVRSDIDRQDAADTLADELLPVLTGEHLQMSSITLVDTPACPVTAVEPGDEVLVSGDAGTAGQVAIWVRVHAVTRNIADNHATLEVIATGALKEAT